MMATNVTTQISSTSTTNIMPNRKSNVVEQLVSQSEEMEPAVPDSTTPLERERTEFSHGEDVLFKHKDGRYYLGTVVEIDYIRDQCLLRFGDNTENWASTRDLTKLSSPDEDLLCVICKKSSPKDQNDVVVCDKCGRGYHLLCHQPTVSLEFKDESNIWHCKKCVESQQQQRRIRDSNMFTDVNRGPVVRRVVNKDTIRKICSGPDEVNKSLPTDRSKLPYDPDLLNWDTYHRVNMEQIYCYCGRNGEWYTQMLQCGRCKQWFHEKCVQCLQYPLYCGDRFYVFVCSICNDGKEFLRRLEMKWVDMVHLMLFNLTAFNAKKYYDLDTVIIPYINDNWHALQLPPKIHSVSKMERRENILSVLTNNRNRFKCGREIKKRTTIWGLRVRLPPPAPCVTLPSVGPISETELKERWHGNRRLQFLPLPQVQPGASNSGAGATSQMKGGSVMSMVVPVDPEMVGLMMGMAYHDTVIKSESDSPCPSPEIDKKPLTSTSTPSTTVTNADDKLETVYKSESDSPCPSPNSAGDKITPKVESPSKQELEKCMKTSFEGAGFVKRSVPFPQKTAKTNKRRKRLLIVNRDKIILRRHHHQLVRKLSRKNTSEKKMRRNLRKSDNKAEQLPPTPPTSVSAPPTPPATAVTTTPTLIATISEEVSSDSISEKTPTEVVTQANTPCDTSGDETSSKSTLDLIIPPPKDFEGKNNPFRSLSSKERQGIGSSGTQRTTQHHILQGNATTAVRSGHSLPLSLTPVMPLIRTLKRQLSEKDICIGPNGEVKRRRHRRTRANLQHTQGATASKTATILPPRCTGESQRQLRSTNVQQVIPNCMEYALNGGRRLRARHDKNPPVDTTQQSKTIPIVASPSSITSSPVKSEPNINMDDLKTSVNMYFGAANRIASGEKYQVKASRMGPEGRIQYLIEWEGSDHCLT